MYTDDGKQLRVGLGEGDGVAQLGGPVAGADDDQAAHPGSLGTRQNLGPLIYIQTIGGLIAGLDVRLIAWPIA